MFGEINKMLTVSILVFVVVSIDFWMVSGNSNFTNNSAPSSYSGKYSVCNQIQAIFCSFVKFEQRLYQNYDLIKFLFRYCISWLYIPSVGSSNYHIPTSYLMALFLHLIWTKILFRFRCYEGFMPSLTQAKIMFWSTI